MRGCNFFDFQHSNHKYSYYPNLTPALPFEVKKTSCILLCYQIDHQNPLYIGLISPATTMKQSLTNFVHKKFYTKGIIRLGSGTYIWLIDRCVRYHIRTKKLWIRSPCLYVCMHYFLWKDQHTIRKMLSCLLIVNNVGMPYFSLLWRPRSRRGKKGGSKYFQLPSHLTLDTSRFLKGLGHDMDFKNFGKKWLDLGLKKCHGTI